MWCSQTYKNICEACSQHTGHVGEYFHVDCRATHELPPASLPYYVVYSSSSSSGLASQTAIFILHGGYFPAPIDTKENSGLACETYTWCGALVRVLFWECYYIWVLCGQYCGFSQGVSIHWTGLDYWTEFFSFFGQVSAVFILAYIP